MLYLHVWLTVKNADRLDSIRENLAKLTAGSRLEPGCIRFEAYQSEADPMKFLLCEQWETKEAWEQHRQATAFTTIYQPLVLPHVDREPHPSTPLVK